MNISENNKTDVRVIALFLAFALIACFFGDDGGLNTFFIGMTIIIAVSFFIKLSLVGDKFQFSNFLIGNNNRYSLSRLQFLLWVLIILSYQVGLIIYLWKVDHLHLFELVFGTNILWILAASFGTYLSVKGIANKEKDLRMYPEGSERSSDFLVGKKGLDFTRFQMLLWTFIAIFLFCFKVINYQEDINQLIVKKQFADNYLGVIQKTHSHLKKINRNFSLPADSTWLIETRDTLKVFSKRTNQVIDSDSNELKSSFENLPYHLDTLFVIIENPNDKDTLYDVKLIGAVNTIIFHLDTLMNDLYEISRAKETEVKTYFVESTETKKNPKLPDIAMTFLILMGLIQGAYVGKKLLPKNEDSADSGDDGSNSGSKPNPKPDPGTDSGDSGNDQNGEKSDSGNRNLGDKDKHDNLRNALREAQKKYLHLPYVTGVDKGVKYKGEKAQSEIAVRIHVDHKQKLLEIDMDREVFPKNIQGVPTDVIESNFKLSSSDCTGARVRVNTLQPGISIGNKNESGTLGLLVHRDSNNKEYLLSNYHVIRGMDVYQPSLKDGGSKANDLIAKVDNASTDLILDERGDAGLALIVDQRLGLLNETFQSQKKISGTRKAKESDHVNKCGKTTCETKGFVDGVGSYKIPDHPDIFFESFMIRSIDPNEKISDKGDSGSIYYDPVSGEGLGLHFAGDIDEQGKYALACHLSKIIEDLNCEIL